MEEKDKTLSRMFFKPGDLFVITPWIFPWGCGLLLLAYYRNSLGKPSPSWGDPGLGGPALAAESGGYMAVEVSWRWRFRGNRWVVNFATKEA